MSCPRSVPKYFRPLSLRVCRVLDRIGASETIRNARMDKQINDEVWNNLLNDGVEEYVFGSAAEGTRTYGTDSDQDFLICHATIPVCQNIEGVAQNGKSLLLVHDGNTKAGYGKLQLLYNGKTITEDEQHLFGQFGYFSTDVDVGNRIVLTNLMNKKDSGSNTREEQGVRHGPALTFPSERYNTSLDTVYAYKCKDWPESAKTWLTRQRKYNWPPFHMIETMKTYGFFMVPVGHAGSNEQFLEWRESLSLQERFLMYGLNPVQFKCYVLLKIIKKDIISHFVEDESISSYHCKTCLFYMIENTPGEFWVPENFLTCLVSCLELILMWSVDGICPNYFIPGENMFDRRVQGPVKQKLTEALKKLLSSDCMFLLSIKCDEFGSKLRSLNELRPIGINYEKLLKVVGSFTLRKYMFLREVPMTTAAEVHENLDHLIAKLKSIETVVGHTKDATRKILSYIIPYLELHQMSTVAVLKMQQDEGIDGVIDHLVNEKWYKLSQKSGCPSALLKQATFLHSVGQEEISLAILSSIQSKHKSIIYKSIGPCHSKRALDFNMTKEFINIQPGGGSSETEKGNTQRRFSCVEFLPIEKEIIPAGLRYEMLRAKGTCVPPGIKKEKSDHWYTWSVVDANFLLYFLLYLNHNNLGMEKEAEVNLGRLEELLETDANLTHKESDLNILGWLYKKRGEKNKANECFKKSLNFMKTCNAAMWHLKDM